MGTLISRMVLFLAKNTFSKAGMAALVGGVYLDDIFDNLDEFIGDINLFSDDKSSGIDTFIRLLLETLNDAWFRTVIQTVGTGVTPNHILTPLATGGALMLAYGRTTAQQLKGLIFLEVARTLMMNPTLRPKYDDAKNIYESIFSIRDEQGSEVGDGDEGDENIIAEAQGGTTNSDAKAMYDMYIESPMGGGILSIIPSVLTALAWTADQEPLRMSAGLSLGDAINDMFTGENFGNLSLVCAAVTTNWQDASTLMKSTNTRYNALFARVRIQILQNNLSSSISSGENDVINFSHRLGFKGKRNGQLLPLVEMYVRSSLMLISEDHGRKSY